MPVGLVVCICVLLLPRYVGVFKYIYACAIYVMYLENLYRCLMGLV